MEAPLGGLSKSMLTGQGGWAVSQMSLQVSLSKQSYSVMTTGYSNDPWNLEDKMLLFLTGSELLMVRARDSENIQHVSNLWRFKMYDKIYRWSGKTGIQ